MQVGRWGDGLAVRLPTSVVEALSLKEGDEIAVEVAGKDTISVKRGLTREEALKTLRSLDLKLPPGYKFNRDELYDE